MQHTYGLGKLSWSPSTVVPVVLRVINAVVSPVLTNPSMLVILVIVLTLLPLPPRAMMRIALTCIVNTCWNIVLARHTTVQHGASHGLERGRHGTARVP